VTQHADLTREDWSRHTFPRQLLMIANEMNRAGKLQREDDGERRERAYERVLRLTDLTIGCLPRKAVLRELLRWRDLAAALYLGARRVADTETHYHVFKVLLLMNSETARQRAFVIPLETAVRPTSSSSN
jgi:hypothetical protein